MKTEEMAVLLLQEADYKNITCSEFLKTADLASIQIPGWPEEEMEDRMLILSVQKRCLWKMPYEMHEKKTVLKSCLYDAIKII